LKTLLCRLSTPWTKNGAFDEQAFREYVERFIDTNIGIYMGTGGVEGFTLTSEELHLCYRVGVEECKGKVFVGANLAEEHTARRTIERARIAVEEDVDVVNIYGPAGWHGFIPTDAEYLAFFDLVLAEIRHPVALCPNKILGYQPGPKVISEIVGKYGQVVAVNLSGVPDDVYFVNLKDCLPRDVEIYVDWQGSLNTLGMGATGLLGVAANVIPKTFRKYLDAYESGDMQTACEVYADLKRFAQFSNAWQGGDDQSPEGKGGNGRWIKMAHKVFRIPGGEGGLREPYLMPDEARLERFAKGAIALNIPELNELARDAGLVR
jgi:4-hydroxy-tetrahydrodipicolinate synthase